MSQLSRVEAPALPPTLGPTWGKRRGEEREGDRRPAGRRRHRRAQVIRLINRSSPSMHQVLGGGGEAVRAGTALSVGGAGRALASLGQAARGAGKARRAGIA
jgi:hypothetical protein